MSLTKKCLTGLNSKTCAVLGAQWGDEGKGKLVDILAANYDYVARFNGGANAGHTIKVNGIKYALHLLPCGIMYQHCINVLGNGCVVNIPSMFDELKQLDRDRINYDGRLLVSDRAHIVTNLQIAADKKSENQAQADPNSKKFIGTTQKGIGPTYASKINRIGLRVGDLKYWDSFTQKYNQLANILKKSDGVVVDTEAELKELKQYRDIMLEKNMIVDTVYLMNQALKQNKRVLFEGANATMLDIDFGTYPYVTSSSTWAGGVMTGLGVPPTAIETSIAIVKAYCTRVGEGPFPTELLDQRGKDIQKIGGEFGATTGRPRRCGWLDIPAIKYAHMINDFTSINMTKLDVLDGMDEIYVGAKYTINGKQIEYMPSSLEEYSQVKVEYEKFPGWKTDISKVTKFSELPQNAKNYVKGVEELLQIPITWVGNGPARESTLQNF